MKKHKRIARIFGCAVIAAVMIGMHNIASAQDYTITKTICFHSSGKHDENSFFRFDHTDHKYNISYQAPSELRVYPSSPIDASSGAYFTVYAHREGTFTVKVTYDCVDPGCVEHGTADIVFKVINCDPVESHSIYDGNDDESFAPDVDDVDDDENFLYTDPVTKTKSPESLVITTSSAAISILDPKSPSKTFLPPVKHAPSHLFNYGPVVTAPKGRAIVSKVIKKYGEGNQAYVATYVLFDNGEIESSTQAAGFGPSTPSLVSTLPPDLTAEGFVKFWGDDLYIATTNAVAVSRDSAKSWQIDTLGLGSLYVYDLTLDTSQNVYLATSKGLFKQTPKGSSWNLVSSFPQNYATKVFGSKHDIIFVSTFQGIIKSADEGATWTYDSLGFGKAGVYNFGEDVYKNIYALRIESGVTSLYKRSPGKSSWENMQSGLSDFIADFNTHYALHAVAGDSALYVASTFGVFESTDQGTAWHPYNNGLRPNNFYGLVRDPQGLFYLGTNQGIFKGHLDDSDWSKLYPKKGNLNGSPIFRDNSGNLYGLGKTIPQTNFLLSSRFAKEPVRSSDGGVSWLVDSLGISKIAAGIYYVDEFGTQYTASIVDTFKVFSKHPGQPWKEDDAGLPVAALNGAGTALQSDGHGSLFLAASLQGSGGVWKRPISGGTWVADSVGLQRRAIYIFARDNNGLLYGGTYQNGIVVQKSGVWQSVPYPPFPAPVSSQSSVFALSIDSANTLLAVYGNFDGSFTYHMADMYYQRNGSTVWNPTNVNANNCSTLISVYDTTYLLTDRGIMSFSSAVPSSVNPQDPSGPQSFLISDIVIQPNPSYKSARVSFTTHYTGTYMLEIFDVLGKEKLTQQGKGISGEDIHLEFDLSEWSEGSYYVRLQQGNQVRSAKIVIKR